MKLKKFKKVGLTTYFLNDIWYSLVMVINNHDFSSKHYNNNLPGKQR